jgi:transcriptional regulator with XRE-family HTH domain
VEAVTAAVAQHVRALRQARGWSLDELSGRSGVSKGMVVQIEAARTNPSVGTLTRIADAFGVTVARLLEPAADRTVKVTSADDAPLLWRGGSLTVTVDGTTYAVQSGDTIDFRADKPHGYRNDGDQAVRLLMVIAMPPGDFDRRRS